MPIVVEHGGPSLLDLLAHFAQGAGQGRTDTARFEYEQSQRQQQAIGDNLNSGFRGLQDFYNQQQAQQQQQVRFQREVDLEGLKNQYRLQQIGVDSEADIIRETARNLPPAMRIQLMRLHQARSDVLADPTYRDQFGQMSMEGQQAMQALQGRMDSIIANNPPPKPPTIDDFINSGQVQFFPDEQLVASFDKNGDIKFSSYGSKGQQQLAGEGGIDYKAVETDARKIYDQQVRLYEESLRAMDEYNQAAALGIPASKPNAPPKPSFEAAYQQALERQAIGQQMRSGMGQQQEMGPPPGPPDGSPGSAVTLTPSPQQQEAERRQSADNAGQMAIQQAGKLQFYTHTPQVMEELAFQVMQYLEFVSTVREMSEAEREAGRKALKVVKARQNVDQS